MKVWRGLKMLPNLTMEYNMTNWREATKEWKFVTYYTHKYQNDTVYLFHTSPSSEAWIFNNPAVLAAVRRGLSDAAQGRVSKVNLDTL